MGFLEGVKKAAWKTKLQGELVLVDREITAEKRRAGFALFHILYAWEATETNELQNLPVKGESGSLAAIYLAAKEDIMANIPKRQIKEEELETLEAVLASAEAAPPADTAAQKAKNAKRWISLQGNATKLKAEIAFYDREINVRKEIFGIQAYDELDLSTQALNFASSDQALFEKIDSGDENMPSLPPMNATDEDVQKVLDQIKRSVGPLVQSKLDKERESMAL